MTLTNNDVVITGLGPVSSIGSGHVALWESLLAGRANVAMRTLPVDIAKTVELPIASMPNVQHVPGLAKYVERLAEQDLASYRDLAYAGLAVELALEDAGLTDRGEADRIGMIQAFEAPGVEATVSALFGMFQQPLPTDGPPAVYDLLAPRFYYMQPFLYVHVLAKWFGMHGFCTNVHNACSTGAFAIETAAQQIRSGDADVMIVVGGEAFDTAVRLEWFRRLNLYATELCMRPFDPSSSGFYVGEGGAAIVLESVQHARKRGVAPYAAYIGGAFAHQAWKQTIPDVRAARLADVITSALKRSGLQPSDIDLIIPHGAGTGLSDGYERSCMKRGLSDQAADASVAVFKPNVGHMLAASGIMETICGVLAMKHATVPPVLYTDPNSVDLPATMTSRPIKRLIRAFLKTTTGFTGHDAASVFAAPQYE